MDNETTTMPIEELRPIVTDYQYIEVNHQIVLVGFDFKVRED